MNKLKITKKTVFWIKLLSLGGFWGSLASIFAILYFGWFGYALMLFCLGAWLVSVAWAEQVYRCPKCGKSVLPMRPLVPIKAYPHCPHCGWKVEIEMVDEL